MNQDYQDAIKRMVFWRRIEATLLWLALGWPLALFLHISAVGLLLGWYVLLILIVIAHFNRKTARKAASELHDKYETNSERDADE